ncbi:PilW family protein [Hydromonas duriensis]|uniref:Prepilin-type N-terminal cleavage/methylation domain-containing protein n=1 Tax=Hydromonas duriensis TaxID=1527608 RepID=A0A4R6Y8W2_9BURK|nr:prepilin-type N-terminal cleavage/methylation domain-containing protein [Hydromonas duriensis]TDR31857.1 prepilin-type N-terminal cleavage/methylation domain-containing protein [Hydromonas duriensis]
MRNSVCYFPKQAGFTLLELLISLSMVLLVVVGVQMFTSGVVFDQKNISEDHDQSTQTRIALTNIQRDVAQSGFYPLLVDAGFDDEAKSLFSKTQKNYLGVQLVCLNNGVCTGLNVGSIQPVGSATDCNGNGSGADGQLTAEQYAKGGSFLPGTDVPVFSKDGKWAIVYNQYSVDSVLDTLTCRGSGASERNGYRARLSHLANDNASVHYTAVTNDNLGLSKRMTAPANRLVSLCIITLENATAAPAVPVDTDCAGGALSPAGVGKAYVKTHIDMPVYTESFIAGAP